MPSKEGSSASASDCSVCCAKMRGAIHIDSNKINNERIFIPDLYPQIRRLPHILFCHPERSEAQSRDPAELPRRIATGFLDFARNDSSLYKWNLRRTRCS